MFTTKILINVREYQRGNPKYTMQKNWQHSKTKQKHNPIGVVHHYVQTNINNVNKTCALLQTTGGKDELNIVSMRKSFQISYL
jgi:hypothetical protein